MDSVKPLFRSFSDGDLSGIIEIADLHFGKNYLNKERFISLLNQEGCFVYVLELKEKIIAFTLLILLEKEVLKQRLQLPKKALDTIIGGSNILCIKTIAVHPNYLKQGYGDSLMTESLAKLNGQFQYLISLNWKRKADIPMSGLSLKLGMKPLLELKEFWKKQSIIEPYDCPECGQPPCTCDMIIYLRT